MKKTLKKLVGIVLILVLIIPTGIPNTNNNVEAATKAKITMQDYIIRLVKALDLEVTDKANDSYINAAIESGLLKENEKTKLNKNITNQYVAELTSRADKIMMGEKYSYNEKLYYQIIDYKRIYDISKASNNYKDSIYIMFLKGIMPGYSKGKYSKNRAIKPTSYITLSEAETVISRLIIKSKRIKISADGQVIRTTNLPKNYKNYSYILESFPNNFYQEKLFYQKIKWGRSPTNLVDYASPKDLLKIKFITYSKSYEMKGVLGKYQKKWIEKVERNLSYRLNVNYKTIDSKWINELRNTYPVYSDKSMNQDYIDAIKQYSKIIKDNKVMIKSSKIIVEPSTMYYCTGIGITVRCHVKFKISSAKKFYSYESGNQRLMIYGSDIYLKGLKKNKWYEATFDMGLSGNNMNDDGEGYAVTSDWMY